VHGRRFLPGTYQPTVLRNSGSPVLYLDPPKELRSQINARCSTGTVANAKDIRASVARTRTISQRALHPTTRVSHAKRRSRSGDLTKKPRPRANFMA